MYNPFSLSGKTIAVTGASSGIGKAIAIECSKMGAQVAITGRDSTRLAETYGMLEGTGHQQIIAELNNERDIKQFTDSLPVLNGVVHCAGITMHLPFSFTSKEKLEHIFSVNFNAPVLMTQQLLKRKKIERNASIVFISSTAGVAGTYPSGSLYSATKGALCGIAKGMAVDLAPKKIRVNCVCPAMVQTNILSEGAITEEQIQKDLLRYPLRRYGKPEEVAYAVIYLLSNASEWTTGTNLLMDGGVTLL